MGRQRELVCFKDMANYILRDIKETAKQKRALSLQQQNSSKQTLEKWNFHLVSIQIKKIFAGRKKKENGYRSR